MATYIGLIVINAFCSALYLVLSSKTMKHQGHSPNLAIAVVHLTAAIFLAIFVMLSDVDGAGLTLLALVFLSVVVLLKLLGKEMHFYAYAHTDVANVTVFSGFIPIIGMVFGVILLGESPKVIEVIGAIIICVAIYLLFLKREKGKHFMSATFSPFIAIFGSLPLLFAFLSIIPPALAPVFIKKSLFTMDPLAFSFLFVLLVGLSAFVIELILHRKQAVRTQLQLMVKPNLLFIGLIFSLALYSFVLALTMEEVGHTMALQRLSIIFQMVLAYVLLRERTDIAKRLFYGMIILLGCFLVGYYD